MKDLTVDVKLERYIREWLVFHLGNPVRFPECSFENALLHRFLSKRPADAPVGRTPDDCVAVVITDCRYRKPEHYNYIGREGLKALASAIDALFRLHLWAECAPLLQARGELNRGIDEWCARNGISLDAREAVRQKFYRIRKAYVEKGIVVSKIYSKKRAMVNVKNEQPKLCRKSI